ncbi:MAG: hypothetical protein LBS41_06665 [Streptococcaceae bacterium]|jgi:uncharacterized BrkB/YihY/UPF0761 family membrane protein|nr:hypothetical protein [Streptococcaceae bacterium]
MQNVFTLLATGAGQLAGQPEYVNGQEVIQKQVLTWPDNLIYMDAIIGYFVISAVLGLLLFFLIKKQVLKGHNKGIGIFVTAMALVVIGLIINAAIGNFGTI